MVMTFEKDSENKGEALTQCVEATEQLIFEALGRLAVRYLQDRHDKKEFGIEHYMDQAPPMVDKNLVRSALEMAAALHNLADSDITETDWLPTEQHKSMGTN